MRQIPLAHLRADCANCFGLCCVAPAFARSSDFAIDKPAGHACPNLGVDFRCGIHSSLRSRGFVGCTVFDCFGAGQRASQATYGGRSWQDDPDRAGQMFAVFGMLRHLHELLYYLTEALAMPRAAAVHAALGEARDGIEALAGGTPEELLALDVAPLRTGVGELLGRASELVRAAVPAGGAGPAGGRRRSHARKRDGRSDTRKRDRRGADLTGAVLTGTDLRGATLRGAYLIGADLTDADLRDCDLLGADLRGANLAGANLEGALFLLQSQVDSATGDTRTKLPGGRTRPAHWGAAPDGVETGR